MEPMTNTKTIELNIPPIEDFSKIELYDKYVESLLRNEELWATIEDLKGLLKLGVSDKFGPSSEKRPEEAPLEIDPGVFNEAEDTVEEEKKSPVRRKAGEVGPNKASFDHLPVEEAVFSLEEDAACPRCGSALRFVRADERIELEIVPARIIKKRYLTSIYSCKACDESGKNPIVTAPGRLPVFAGSFVSPSLLAYIMAKKYWEKMPIYRLEKVFEQSGVDLSRQAMSRWVIDGSHLYLLALWERMRQTLLDSDIIHADETPLQVLKEPGRSAKQTSYMWHYASGKEEERQVRLYQYCPGRSGKFARVFLQGFSGYLHTDGYPGYNKVEGVVHIGCFAHARRKFIEAQKALPDKVKGTGTTLTEEGLAFFDKLFEKERSFADLSPNERYQHRLEEVKPLLEDFLAWLKKNRLVVTGQSLLGKAIGYALNQWDELYGFLLDGRLETTNNRAERGIKEFVIGRKNFLFSVTPDGAKASEIVYSIVETAKANALNPYEYLKYVIETLSQNKQTEEVLDKLLPWSGTLPDHVRAGYSQP